MFTRQEAEGKRLRNPFDTITEGIGINRETSNFKLAQIDSAFQGTDREAVEMVRCPLCWEFLASCSWHHNDFEGVWAAVILMLLCAAAIVAVFDSPSQLLISPSLGKGFQDS